MKGFSAQGKGVPLLVVVSVLVVMTTIRVHAFWSFEHSYAGNKLQLVLDNEEGELVLVPAGRVALLQVNNAKEEGGNYKGRKEEEEEEEGREEKGDNQREGGVMLHYGDISCLSGDYISETRQFCDLSDKEDIKSHARHMYELFYGQHVVSTIKSNSGALQNAPKVESKTAGMRKEGESSSPHPHSSSSFSEVADNVYRLVKLQEQDILDTLRNTSEAIRKNVGKVGESQGDARKDLVNVHRFESAETEMYSNLTLESRIAIFSLLFSHDDHFHDGKCASKTYKILHSFALSLAYKAGKSSQKDGLLEAYAVNAMADHFLMDMFASGHIRVPTRAFRSLIGVLGGFWTRRMHDEDNANCLNVENSVGDRWLSCGDNFYFLERHRKGRAIIQKALQQSVLDVFKGYWDGKKGRDGVYLDEYKALDFAPNYVQTKGLPVASYPMFMVRYGALYMRKSAWPAPEFLNAVTGVPLISERWDEEDENVDGSYFQMTSYHQLMYTIIEGGRQFIDVVFDTFGSGKVGGGGGNSSHQQFGKQGFSNTPEMENGEEQDEKHHQSNSDMSPTPDGLKTTGQKKTPGDGAASMDEDATMSKGLFQFFFDSGN
eukprot:Nk52_evm11s366 gene=Nk52_evmTU11s366